MIPAVEICCTACVKNSTATSQEGAESKSTTLRTLLVGVGDDDDEGGEDEENNNKNKNSSSESESEEEEEEEVLKTQKQDAWNKNKKIYKEEIDVDDI